MSAEETDKLLQHGEGWLAEHPEREFITRRYLRRGPRLAREALERLAALEAVPEVTADAEPDTASPLADEPASLNDLRHQTVLRTLRDAGCRLPDRAFGGHVVRNHVQLLRRSLRGLQREGFRVVHVLSSPEDIAGTEIAREPLFTDRRTDHGPFDIIGDVHGCHNELTALLARLGYAQSDGGWSHSEGRRVIFLGDLVDRGPDSPGVLRLVMNMVASGTALCVQGNHDKSYAGKWVTG